MKILNGRIPNKCDDYEEWAHVKSLVIPLERLLVETDAPYQINIGLLVQEKVAVEGELQEGETSNRVEYVRANVSSLSKHYGIDKPAFARKLLENALKAFRLIV